MALFSLVRETEQLLDETKTVCLWHIKKGAYGSEVNELRRNGCEGKNATAVDDVFRILGVLYAEVSI